MVGYEREEGGMSKPKVYGCSSKACKGADQCLAPDVCYADTTGPRDAAWEKEYQRTRLEWLDKENGTSLAAEFPFGCDTIEHSGRTDCNRGIRCDGRDRDEWGDVPAVCLWDEEVGEWSVDMAQRWGEDMAKVFRHMGEP